MASYEKKATVKDIAREAGVSVATVSYILNNRTDQKISAETRKKVLQIANLLNYKPNHAAKSLAQGRNNVIGVAYSLSGDAIARNMEISQLVNLLVSRLTRINYDVLFLQIPEDTSTLSSARNVDAILAIDLSHEDFRSLAEAYMVPIISIDMIIDDNLFYQVYTDYPVLLAEAAAILGTDDYYILTDPFCNSNFADFSLKNITPSRIISFAELATSDFSPKKIVVLGAFLALMAYPYLPKENIAVISTDYTRNTLPSDIPVILNDIDKKANMAINLLLNALDRKFEVSHDYKISH